MDKLLTTGEAIDFLANAKAGQILWMDESIRFIQRTNEGVVWDIGTEFSIDSYTMFRKWRLIDLEYSANINFISVGNDGGQNVAPIVTQEQELALV